MALGPKRTRAGFASWKPECGFLHYGWEGYNEATILYVLAMASPTYPVTGDSFRAWTLTYQWENLYGCEFLYAGPLFVHQFSHAFIDFRGIRDRFMREKRSDYIQNSVQAIFVQREYARRDPLELEGYGERCWGISAGEGPSGYSARAVPYGPYDGTIAPSATLAALPFSPDLALSAVRHMRERYPSLAPDFRLPSGFNPTRAWVSEGHSGLDQGIVVDNALFFGRERLSALTIPWCTYTDPEIAHVGLYVRDASERRIPVKTFTVLMHDVDRAVTDAEEDGFVKVHVREGTDEILGATVVARHAGEMINDLSLAMTNGIGLSSIARVIRAYPTQAAAIKVAADAYETSRATPTRKKLRGSWNALMRRL